MEFKESKSIYVQIADQICDRIISNEWSTGGRIPAIRELAADMGVNPNTVTRSYKELMENGVIYNQRGIGYFVADDAPERIINQKKNDFLRNELPHFFKLVDQLGIEWSELEELYTDFKQNIREVPHA